MPGDGPNTQLDSTPKPTQETEPYRDTRENLFRDAYLTSDSRDTKDKSSLKTTPEKGQHGDTEPPGTNGDSATADGTANGKTTEDVINSGLRSGTTAALYDLKDVADTLGPEAALAFFGIKPGGDKADPAAASGDLRNGSKPTADQTEDGGEINPGGVPKAPAPKTTTAPPAASTGTNDPADNGHEGNEQVETEALFVGHLVGHSNGTPDSSPDVVDPNGAKRAGKSDESFSRETREKVPPPRAEKTEGDRTVDRTPPPVATKFDNNGRRLNTSSDIKGVGRVDFEATRGKDNQITSLDMKIGDNKYKLSGGKDGDWSLKTPDGKSLGPGEMERANKALEALGIKLDDKRNFKGKLDITTDGKVRYQNLDKPDKPDHKSTYLSRDGSSTTYDYGSYTRTNIDKAGTKSVEAWNGKEFVPVVGETIKTGNKDGSITYTSTLKHGTNLKVERTTNPKDPSRDETKFTKRNENGTAGEVSNYKWLEGAKTTNGKTTYLDDSTGRYRDGKKEGNTVTFTDRDPSSRVSSVTRDAKSGTVTYKGSGGFELQKNMHTDQVISSKTADGHYKFEYDSSGGKDSGAISAYWKNGEKYTRVSPNKEAINHDIALGRKSLNDFKPKTNDDLNEYRNQETGKIEKTSLAVGQDGTVKVATAGKDGGKPTTQEFRPEISFTSEKDLAAAKQQLKVKTDENGKAIGYEHKDANLKLTRTKDGWKAETLDDKEGFKEPTEFQKKVYTSDNLNEAQKLNLLSNDKAFDGMKFDPKQKKEVRDQATRLLEGRKDSALPPKEKAALAYQLFHHIVNSDRNDQGRNNTCNVTVLRTMALKEKPEVVAKLAADVANDGEFKTKDNQTIKVPMDSVKVRPGSPEATFPPADGARSALGKLWDVSTINAIKQTESGGVTYKEVAPTERADTGGRLFRTRTDGKTEVKYSKPGGGGDKPYDSPDVQSGRLADAWNKLTGDTLKDRFLSHVNRGLDHKDLQSGKIANKEQLHNALVNGTAGGKSLIVQGNTGDLSKIANKLPNRPAGGEHVWTVTGYNPITKQATVQNSWGKPNDIKMSLDSLYNTMQAPSPNKRGSSYWRPIS
ncbi:MAG: hypothetical protein K2X93_15675 [Candidatus Obscuribacterales bacterium]|nr:hypothetical protein [Candidatus Obscuribacterales bacterium]